jgi:hypothetical protein
VLAAGCEQPRTEVVARVDSEVAWGAGAAVQSVTFTVRRGGPTGPLRSARTTALGVGGDRRPLPLSVGILPTVDIDTPVWIEALGCGDPNGCTPMTAVVAQRAVVRFTRGHTEEVPLLLASACVGATCGSDERCGTTGRCEPATRATVRPFDGFDAGPVADVASDAGGMDRGAVADAPMTDAGSPVDRNDLGTAVDAVVPVDAPAPDVPTADTVAVPDTATSCGALELQCGGVCRRVLTDPANCGDCGAVCPAPSGATPTCMGGRCGYACDAAHADCDERPSNGCEVTLATEHEHCGRCGTACTDRQECRSGVCVACGGSLDWCAGRGCGDNGTDRNHCGACTTVCMPGFVCRGSGCVTDLCTPPSMPPDAGDRRVWLNCPSGCVDIYNDIHNCGRCGHSCSTGPNGSGVACSFGGCVITECVPPFRDCDGSAVNGCETNVRDDVHRCGSCTRDCAAVCAAERHPCGATCRCQSGATCQCNP